MYKLPIWKLNYVLLLHFVLNDIVLLAALARLDVSPVYNYQLCFLSICVNAVCS